MKIRGLFKLNEITSIQMPKIRMDRSKRKEIKIPNHQIKGFIRMLNFQKIITFYPSQGLLPRGPEERPLGRTGSGK
jgi:hypothetical protein